MDTDQDGAQRAFLQEQIGLLRTIAQGASKHDVLLELTRAADRLQPGLRSCILLANQDLTAVAESTTGDFPAEFSQAIAGAPIDDIPFGTCGAAMHGQHPVGCADIERSTRWAPQWRQLCLAYGIVAGYSTPVFVDGRAVASFFMCFHERRAPSPWEIQIAGMSAQVAGIALERERAREAEEKVRRSEAELRRALAELQQVDRRKDQFLATLAHELRNPLAPVRSGLEVLKLAASDAQTANQAREMMERQVNHLVRLVDDLLDVSRITSGKVELRIRSVRLQEVARDAVESCRPFLHEKGLQLAVDLPVDDVWVMGDPTRLSQIIANLLHNAGKFTPAGGRISLAAFVADGQATLEVHDSGIGIDASSLGSVFDLFTQLHTQEPPQGGLGIGLSLVKSLVGMHGGEVQACSEGAGRGSVFRVKLPVAECTEVPPQGDRAAECDGQPWRVLVVDDNVDAASMLATMLTLRGHVVHAVHTAAAALEQAGDFGPDLALLDIGLPDMTGYELAKRLRAEPRTQDIALAALTGWGTAADIASSRDAGIGFHLTKPASSADISDLLATLQASKRVRAA